MCSSAEYREKATQCAKSAVAAAAPQDRENFLRMEKAYLALAANEDWLNGESERKKTPAAETVSA